MAATACGTRLSHQELLGAASGMSGVSGTGTGTQSNDATAASGNGLGSDNGTAGGPSGTSVGDRGGIAGLGAAPTSGPAGSATATQGAAANASCSGHSAPIVIGSVGEQSGVVGATVGEGPKAVQAWAAAVNATGGLNCHPVRYIIADDQGDPSRNQALVQQLVEQNHAVTFVQMDAPIAGQASLNYLTQHRIPVIGSEAGSPWFYQSPMYFPQASSGPLLVKSAIFSVAQVAKQRGLTKVGILACIEASICSSATQLGPPDATAAGLQPVYNGSASLTQPDYTSNCLDAQKAGAQILIMSFDINSDERIARSCSSVGYRPLYDTAAEGAKLSFPSEPDLNGIVIGMPVRPWYESGNARVAQFQAVLKQFAPGLQADAGTVIGWVSAKMFEAAASHMPETPTPQAVLDGLYGLHGNDLGGLTTPLNFASGQNAPATFCYWIAQALNGKWVSPVPGAPFCQ